MTRSDWLSVILKALGFYFAVTAIAQATGILYFLDLDMPKFMIGRIVNYVVATAIYLFAAYLLIARTATCLRWCGESAK